MTFEVVIAPLAELELANFAAYAAEFSEDFAAEQFRRLNHVFSAVLAESPLTWGPFFVTGAPYHGYLFRAGRRTQFWIVYTVDEEKRRVNVLRFWNAGREPAAFEV